uniref:Uncharacterized protein n=2 Tax=Anguilla anguilla TaxID=7936 RepID=A0A0E9Q1S1_ANGAN
MKKPMSRVPNYKAVIKLMQKSAMNHGEHIIILSKV